MNTNSHLTEDELVLHYYGELTTADEAQTSAHLGACRECQDNLRRLQQVLAVVDDTAFAGPELPAHFERTVWARLEPNLPGRDRRRWSWFVYSPARLAWVASIVLLIGAAFMAGRLLPRSDVPTTVTTTPDSLRERILLMDLDDHLDRSELVLVELASTADNTALVDISGERARAEQLVAANRLYRQTAATTGDSGIVELLDELERVLVELAASPEEVSAADLEVVRERIESRSLLFKLRVISSEIRERQRKSIRQEPSGQRSTL